MDSTNLENMPSEILVEIFSYLNFAFLHFVVRSVCRRFYYLISNEKFWHIRLRRAFGTEIKKIPISRYKNACIELGTYTSDNFVREKCSVNISSHGDSIHALSLFNNGRMVVFGSRCGTLSFHSINRELETTKKEVEFVNACNSWVWSIKWLRERLSVLSFGGHVHLRDISDLRVVKSWQTKYSLLSQCFEADKVILSGSSDGQFYRFDERMESPVTDIKISRHAVISMVKPFDNKTYIIVGTNFKTLKLLDTRALPKCINLCNTETAPIEINSNDENVLAGDCTGNLYFLTIAQGLRVDYKQPIHKTQITGLELLDGILISCSTDKSIRFAMPSLPSFPLHCIEVEDIPLCLDVYNDIICFGSSKDGVHLYWPKPFYGSNGIFV